MPNSNTFTLHLRAKQEATWEIQLQICQCHFLLPKSSHRGNGIRAAAGLDDFFKNPFPGLDACSLPTRTPVTSNHCLGWVDKQDLSPPTSQLTAVLGEQFKREKLQGVC